MVKEQRSFRKVKVVVDTNIVFSSLLSAESTISDLLLHSNEIFEFFAPDFLLFELKRHESKLLKLSAYRKDDLLFVKTTILKRINFIQLEAIRSEIWEAASTLTKNVDEFDTPFVALAIDMNAYLWTGDKRLSKGLIEQGFNNLISTNELLNIRGDSGS